MHATHSDVLLPLSCSLGRQVQILFGALLAIASCDHRAGLIQLNKIWHISLQQVHGGFHHAHGTRSSTSLMQHVCQQRQPALNELVPELAIHSIANTFAGMTRSAVTGGGVQ